MTASQILGVAKEEEPSVFSRYSARGIGAILKRYGLHSKRAGGKRYFRPTDAQLTAIQDTYGINLALDKETEPADMPV